ncbi:MAG: cation diffusion facilitator family transporter [Alphaproteobacteria bacterium]|nr:cation diffusion facilitator family transporter [Alphaproteobacteria bacterium]
MASSVNSLEYQLLLTRAAYASIFAAASLIVIKIGAFLITDSVSIFASLVDSLLDIAASLINFFAIRHAVAPADHEHRFGHGKLEAMAALAQSAFIAGSALFLFIEVGRRFIYPRQLDNVPIGVAVMIVSIVVTGGLVVYQRYIIQKTKSLAISVDSIHYLGDLLSNGSVIVALLLTQLWQFPSIDPIFGAAIAFYILGTSWFISKKAFDMLMDRELPDAEREKILKIIYEHASVRNVHDLKTRTAGQIIFIQFHLELDGNISLLTAHLITDQVEAKLLEKYPSADITIHQDPAGVENIQSLL